MFTLRVRSRQHSSRRNLAITGVVALLSTAVNGILPAEAAGGVTAGSTITFSPTGAEQSFVVPAGATMMRVTLAGAPGNDTLSGFSAPNRAVGGLGALVTADIPAPAAGSVVYAEAGGLPTVGFNGTGVGGFNGGGNGQPGSGGGGGATDLRTVSNATGGTLTSRLAVAAGGGGAGSGGADVNNLCYYNGCPPGRGGSAQAASANGGAGQDGPNTGGTGSYHNGGYPGVAGGQGGAGGSQTAGGAGGQQQNPNNNCDIQSIPFGGVGGSPGAPGTLGVGGQGSTTQTGCSLGQGGGGGGGYYGGGGADGGNGLGTTSGPYASGGGGGGGAGSSYVESSAVTSAFAVDSTKTPRISITFNPTTTSVVCSPSSIAVNSPTTCTATVASVDTSDVVAATGTVSLTRTAGAGTLGAASCSLDATGSCSVPYTPDLGSTAHTIAAAYPGDDAHAASSGSGNLTSTRRTTATTAACVPTTSPVNSSVTCTATVGDSDAGTTSVPAGTVSWTTAGWGTFSPTSCTVAAGQCSVAFTPSPGHEGNAVIVPAYGGDTNHLSSSGSATVPATRRASMATATCTPNDAPVNAATTCTASVHDSTGGTAVTPGGTVSWTVSSGPGSVTPSCTLASAACSVTYTPAPGSEGEHSLALAYAGDTDHTGSSGDVGLTAVTRTTSTAASCSPVTVAVSAPTTCTATVSDTSAATTMQPTGAVTWTVGSGSGDLSQPTCNLASGACSVTYTPAPGSSGPHSLHAVYAGDDDHAGSVDNAALTAGRRSTATTAGCSAPSAAVNATVTCVATVTDTAAGSTSAPTGVATWTLQSGKGTFSPTTCQVSAGFCFTTFTPDPGSVGPDTIRAAYGADTDHAGSTGQYVFAIDVRSTSSSVACSPAAVQVNQATTCTATVTDSDTATPITPTGVVDWTVPGGSGALSAPSCTLSSSACSVTFTPAAGSEGANPLVTAYTGDSNHSGSGSGASVTASQRATTVGASCVPTTQVMNSATTCTASVTDTDAATAVTATGTIAWTVTTGSGDLSTPSCTLAAGACSVTYTPAIGSPASHSLDASYNGDADHVAGTAPAAVTVEQRDATVTATCSPASTVVNSATACTATVADASPATTVAPDGTVAWTVADGEGVLDATSCTLVSGSCSVNFTPAPGSAGDQTLHAAYSGDPAHEAAAQDAAVTALRRSVFLTEMCTGDTGHITVPVSCVASVRDSDAGTPIAPTGRVSWSLRGGGGSFSTVSCTLSSGQCAVQYRPDAGTAGAQTIDAHYVGDSSHVSGGASFDYAVTVVPVTMDAFGHLRGSDGVSLTTARAPAWPTKLARGQALRSGQTGGYTLDAYGGVHAWGSAKRVVTTAHWSGWDIARDIELNPCDSTQKSGYVLDGYGALHPFGSAPSVRMSAYFSGRDIAKAFVVNPCSDGVVSGYVLDGFGSLHSFSSGAAIKSPASAHWRGWNIARSLIVIRAGAGYTLDGFGALHSFGGAPAFRRTSTYFGWDIARDVVGLDDGGGGYIVDGFGGLHAFGTAHSVPGSGYTRWNDIYRFVGIG